MQAHLELNAKQTAALHHLCHETGESPNHILLKIFDEYVERRAYQTWLAEKVASGVDDLNSGRSLTHEENSQRLREWIRKQAEQS